MRVVFMGTPAFAVPTLRALAAAGHDIAAVYTRAPRPAGRGLAEQASPVHRLAEELGIGVLTPRTLKDAAEQQRFAAHAADVAVVVAYGLILPPPVLAAPRHGCLNLHASLLPRWRGAAPIARAIMAGDRETGVMVMRMEEGLDTGPVALAERTAIGADETAGELAERLAASGATLMTEALAALQRGHLPTTSQSAEGATYAAKIDKGETRIDWSAPAERVHNHVRGLSPDPGAWFELPGAPAPLRVRVLHAIRAEGAGAAGTTLDDRLTIACGSGAVRLTELQKAGGKPMPAEAFLRGTKVPAGTVLA
ncbi:MAG: methionyl-tRNA formyltransferase [Bauldia sp.]